jgi:hypothetical protein
LEQLRKTWNAAWLENDAATVDKLMAAEYAYIAPNGQVLDRSAIMGVIRSPSYKINSGTWTELQAPLLSKDAAILLDRWQGTGTFNGSTFTDDHRCSRVCLRRNGTWQIVFEQASEVRAAQSPGQGSRVDGKSSPGDQESSLEKRPRSGRKETGPPKAPAKGRLGKRPRSGRNNLR